MHTSDVLAPIDSGWFKQRAKSLKVRQEVIADAIGRDRSTVSKIFNGVHPLSLSHIPVLARLLQVSRREVIERAGLSLDDPILSPDGEQSDV